MLKSTRYADDEYVYYNTRIRFYELSNRNMHCTILSKSRSDGMGTYSA